MMKFTTPISIESIPFDLDYTNSYFLMGSCFASEISSFLERSHFTTQESPYGILYNPISIAQGLERLLSADSFVKDELWLSGDLYHSWWHHSFFSNTSVEKTLEKINKIFDVSVEKLRSSDRLFITFGTSYVYSLKETSMVVANCHKQPEKKFERKRLDVNTIVERWSLLIERLISMNGDLKILFTVSPIRHWRDGAHANQLSKSILLLAIDEIQKRYPTVVGYFPSYEILMDELRDYRFYADDMFHPSSLAVEYILERFVDNLFTTKTKEVLKRVEEIGRAVNHRPFNVESPAHQHFLMQMLSKIDQLEKEVPTLCLDTERKQLLSQIRKEAH